MASHPLYGHGLALAGALIIAPDTLFMRLSGFDGVEMMAWRGLLMCAVMFGAWTIFSGNRRRDLDAVSSGAGLLAIACQAVNAIVFVMAVASAPVAVVLFAVATVPVWAAILGAIFLGDRIGRATALTSVAVLCGIALSVFGGGDGHGTGGGDPLTGAILGLAVALALAGSFTTYRANPELPILLTVGIGAGISGTLGFTLSESLTASGTRIAAIAVTGAVILPASFLLLSMATRFTSGANVSLFLLLETVLGPVFVWMGTGEAVAPIGLVGGAIVIAALALYLGHERRSLRRSSA